MGAPQLPLSPPYRLKRIRGVRRVEHELYEGWIARNQLGEEIGGEGFRWASRSVAWTVAFESDMFGPFADEKNAGSS